MANTTQNKIPGMIKVKWLKDYLFYSKNKEFKIFNGLDNRINVSDFTLDGSIGNNFSILNNYSSTLWIDNNAIITKRFCYFHKEFFPYIGKTFEEMPRRRV